MNLTQASTLQEFQFGRYKSLVFCLTFIITTMNMQKLNDKNVNLFQETLLKTSYIFQFIKLMILDIQKWII